VPRFSVGIGLVNYAISSRATETILTPELANRLFSHDAPEIIAIVQFASVKHDSLIPISLVVAGSVLPRHGRELQLIARFGAIILVVLLSISVPWASLLCGKIASKEAEVSLTTAN
jgi:hypothetical protein